MIVPGPWPLLLAGLWLWAAAATLLPSGPGYALLLNGRSNTEFAYSYPRRLAPQFTLEMWLTGFAQDSNHVAPISISHPRDAAVLALTDHLTLLGVPVIAPLVLPTLYWYHLAVSVDLSAHPAYDVRVYVNGTLNATAAGRFPAGGLTPADLGEDVMSLVLGQEQAAVLGPFRPPRSFTGLVDDLRVWAVVRSAAEVAAWRSRTLTPPYPAALVSYYNFDDDDWDATYYQDNVNASDQCRLYCADYTNASIAPTPPPAYAPPLTPLPRLGLSWAPLCSTTARLTGYRVGSRGWVAVPITSLYCSDTDDAVTATVTAVSGGSMLTDDYSNALWLPQPSQFTLWFMAYSKGFENVEPGSGFNYTVTDGTSTVKGFLSILPNHLPALFTQLDLVTAEDVRLDSWIVVTDEDRDVVTVRVWAGPGQGWAELDPFVQRTLSYTPPANANGANVGVLTLVAYDWWAAYGKVMAVNVSITPVTDPPQILIDFNFAVYRGQRINVPFQVVDVDGADPVVVLTDLPAASQGRLEAQDRGRTWALNESSAPTKVAWASRYSRTSSQRANATGAANTWIGGMSDCYKEDGDCSLVWAPAAAKSCGNLCRGSASPTAFCSEFFEATFDAPLCLTAFTLWEVLGSDRVSRIQVPSYHDPSQWTVILERDLARSPVSPTASRPSVTKFPVCPVFWPVDRVRVELDTCHRDGWYEVDAAQMRGSLQAPNNVLNGTAQLAFQATLGYTGPVEFSLLATSCYGSPNATSKPITVRVLVMDTPHVITVSPTAGWFPIDVGQLNAGPLRGNVVVLELPSAGVLRYGTQDLNATQEDLVYTSTLFQYKALRCDSSLRDTFIVELGPNAVVQVNVRGCSATTAQLLLFIVPAVVLPVTVAILALGWYWWRHKRNNSKAPKDPNKDICVLFTDIQSSTLLWAEVPHVMASALDAHHALIRKLIRKYKCYEVKTIGDSFMVASSSPLAATELALAIQAELYHQSDADILDNLYRASTGCSLTSDMYNRCWRGLRVRVGVHYGQAQIIFDDTTKGYDYYGTVVNAAARIEGAAHGGQVLLSRQAFEPVADYCVANHVVVRPLGSVSLRGLPAPLDLVQVLPARFAARTFPPLRVEHGPHHDAESKGDLEDGPFEAGCSLLYPQALDWEATNHSMVRSGTLSADLAKFHAYDVYYSLKYLLNMYENPDERRKRLKELCKQWHVECRVATEKQEDATVGRLALQLMGCVANQVHGNSKLPHRAPVPASSFFGLSDPTPSFSLFLSGEGLATPVDALPGLVDDGPEGSPQSGPATLPPTGSLSPSQSGPAHLLSTDDAEEPTSSADTHRTAEERAFGGNEHTSSSSSLPVHVRATRVASAAAPPDPGDSQPGAFSLYAAAEAEGLLASRRASAAPGLAPPQHMRSDSPPLMPMHMDEPAPLVEQSRSAVGERHGWLANHKASSGSSLALLEPTRLPRFMHSAAVHPDAAANGWGVPAREGEGKGGGGGEESVWTANPISADTPTSAGGLFVFEPHPSDECNFALFGVP